MGPAIPSRALAQLRSAHGQVAIEMLGTFWLVLLAALVAWQLALAGWSAVGAANAARTAARDYSRTGNATGAQGVGHTALQNDYLDTGSTVTVGDQTTGGVTYAHADVVVSVPIIVPGLFHSPITIPASANIPKTG